MIPDAAVEAARDVLYENDRSIDTDYATIEAALEAAAPHMLAEAWDSAVSEGESSGWLHDYATEDLRKRNPYRSQA